MHFDIRLDDPVHLLHKGFLGASLKWVEATQHLVQNQARAVPVYGEAVRARLNNLRREVLGCAAEALGHASLLE